MNIDHYLSSLDVNQLSILAAGLSCILSCLLLLCLIRKNRDIAHLSQQIRLRSTRSISKSKVSFKDKEISRIWDFFKLQMTSRSKSHKTAQTYEEAIRLTQQIAGASAEKKLTSEKLVSLLLSVGPEIGAVAVVLKTSEASSLEVEQVSGVPKERIRESLLSLFDLLLDPLAASTEDLWGYVGPEQGKLYDYRVFNIGLSLTVPLQGTNGVIGGLWIGFKRGASVLTPERRNFVQAVAQHGAASYYAAQKASEQTQRTTEERDFLLGMSHDLRSPGNTALYCVKSLLDGAAGPLSDTQMQDLRLIERALQDQLGILADVFDFAKHQKGKLEPQRMPVHLKQVLGATVDHYQRTIALKGLTFSMDPLPEVLLSVDPRHIKRILANFLSNAQKYTDSGYVSLSFKETAKFVEIQVLDSGIGIPEEAIKEGLFQQFQRFKNGRKHQGVGIGLAVTKVLAEANEGYVKYQPNTPSGSIFSVGIPRVLPKDRQQNSSSGRNVSGKSFSRVLVVEDDPGARNTFLRYLREISATQVPASNCEEAKALLREVEFDLLVTDLHLGDGSALDLLDEGFFPCPTIFCSGVADLKTQEPILRSPQTVVLEKPVSRDSLVEAAMSLVRHKSFQQIG